MSAAVCVCAPVVEGSANVAPASEKAPPAPAVRRRRRASASRTRTVQSRRTALPKKRERILPSLNSWRTSAITIGSGTKTEERSPSAFIRSPGIASALTLPAPVETIPFTWISGWRTGSVRAKNRAEATSSADSSSMIRSESIVSHTSPIASASSNRSPEPNRSETRIWDW